jgi:hypothetical protein
MKYLLSITILLVSLGAKAQLVVYTEGPDSIPVYMMGMKSDVDTGTGTKIDFKLIDESTFNKHKKAYKNPVDKDTTRITWLDSTIVVKTAKRNYTYAYRDVDGCYPESVYYYQGYIKPLGLYILTGVSPFNEVGWTRAIDHNNGKVYDIPNDMEGAEMPIPSPKSKFLLVYANDVFEHADAYIGLHKIGKDKEGLTYSYFAQAGKNEFGNSAYSFDSTYTEENNMEERKTWEIEEMVWINDYSFAFKIYQSDYDHWAKGTVAINIKYIVGTFKEN